MYIRIPEYVREQFSYKLHVQNKVSVHEETGYNFFSHVKIYFQPTGSHDYKSFLPKNIRVKRALEGLLYN